MLLLEMAVYGTRRLIHGQNILRSSSFLISQYLYRNVQFSKASLNGVLFYESIFEEGGNRSARRKPSKSG